MARLNPAAASLIAVRTRAGVWRAAVLFAEASLIVLGAAVSTAHAQPASGSAASPAALEEIVVTARKRDERLIDAPVAVYALGEEVLTRYAINDVVSAAKMTPGLIIARATNNSAANIYLRGVGSSFTSPSFDQAVSIVVDNMPISKGRAIYQSYFDMEQVEVLRGPQALFFGKNSTAGVISIRTAGPTTTPEYLVRAGYEFNGRKYYGEAVASGPIAETLGARLALRASSLNGGYFRNIGTLLNGVPRSSRTPQEDEYGGRLTLAFRPSERFDVTVKLNADHLKSDGVNSYSQLVACYGPGGGPQPVFGTPNRVDGCTLDKTTTEVALAPAIAANYPGSRGGRPFQTYTGYLGSATANYRWDGMTLTAVTGYYDYKTRILGNYDMGGSSQIFGHERMDYRSFTQEVRLASSWDGPFNFTAGLFFDDTRLRFARAVRLFTAPPDPATGRTDQWDTGGDTDGNTYSAFLELSYDITPTLDISGGGRFSREVKDSTVGTFFASASTGLPFITTPIDDKFRDNNLSPQATLRWRPNADLTVFASYKRGYKSGGTNLGEITFLGTTRATVHFESETAEGLEAGLKGYLLDRTLSYGITVYRNTFKDLQVSIYDPAATTLHVGNAGRYRTQGVEIDGVYAPPTIEGLRLRGALYYNHARYREYVGPCYTGQTIAQGCNLAFNPVANAFTSQDYKGRRGPRAPAWTASLGADYEAPISGSGLRIGLTGDARYTSAFSLGETLSPLQRQKGYVDLNATVRLFDPDKGWEVALIGRNLTDELVGGNDIDNPGTGAGTGTMVGLVGDTYRSIGTPWELSLQATLRF
jgi:iron complex outermembrane receptor protein